MTEAVHASTNIKLFQAVDLGAVQMDATACYNFLAKVWFATLCVAPNLMANS